MIYIGFTLDLFYLSILGSDELNCNNYDLFFSSYILFTRSNKAANLLEFNLRVYYRESIRLLLALSIELLRIGLRLLTTDDLKLL
jgi:hypothetical protein